MEPSVELQPENTLIVLGPQFTTSLLAGREVPPVGYMAFKKQLDSAMLELTRRQDISLMEDQLQTLQEHRILEQWLSSTFSLQDNVVALKTPLVQTILKLQRLGALIAYLSPDTICEEATGLTPCTLDQTLSWSSSSDGSLLHPFGVYTAPSSLLRWRKITTGQEPLPKELVDVLEKRVTVCIGFNAKQQETDAFYQQFMKLVTMYSKSVPLSLLDQQYPEEYCSEVQAPVTLNIQNIHLPQALCHIGETSKEIACSIDMPPEEDNSLSISLILSNKTGVSNVTKIASHCPGVNFVLMSSINCNGGLELHSLSLRVVKTSVYQFWSTLLSSSTQLIDNGVLCLVFDHGCIVWLTSCDIGNQSPLSSNGIFKNTTTHSSEGGEMDVKRITEKQTMTPTSPSLSPKLKSTTSKQPIPRWFTTKQKVLNGSSLKNTNLVKEDGTPLPSSILHRRLSLPSHPGLPPPQHIKTKQSASLSVSSRQQLLINKYLFTRKHRDSDPAGNSKMLRQLLQEEPKHIPRPDTSKGSPSDLIQKWTVQRRKDLYVKENSDWSSSLQNVLNKKMSKWERLHAKRKQALIEREIKEETLSCSSPSPSAMSVCSSTESLRQQLLSSVNYTSTTQPPLTTPPHSLSSNPLLNPVNPFLLSSGNALPLATPSIIYPTSFLPASYPLLTTFPYVQTALPTQTAPTLPPQTPQLPTPGLILASSVPSSIVTPVTSMTTPAASIRPTNGLQQQRNSTMATLPYSSSMSANSSPSVKAGRKHTISHTPSESSYNNSTSSNSSYISALLKQDTCISSPPEMKKRKMTTSSTITTASNGDRSDGEEDRSRSPQSPRDGDLWQFLLDLLLMNTHSECIQWNPYVTMEFEIKRPKEVAKLWNSYICNNNLKDYSKFKHALDYCCSKVPPILYRVDNGKPGVYRFSNSVLYYISMRYNQQALGTNGFSAKFGQQSNGFSTNSAVNGKLDGTRKISRSKEVLVVD